MTTTQHTEVESRELRDGFRIWAMTEKANGRPFAADADSTIISTLAQQYGAPLAVSAYARAFQELLAAKKVRARQIKVVEPIPADFESQMQNMTSTELRTKLNRDPSFAEIYGRWAAGELPDGAVAKEEYVLTAQQWCSLPPDVAARKMSEPKFRAAVDRLIFRGEI